MKIVWDKGTHLMVEDEDFRGRLRKRRVQRFICVGGPHDGAYRAEFELEDKRTAPVRYRMFNNAGSSKHSAIWIWTE